MTYQCYRSSFDGMEGIVAIVDGASELLFYCPRRGTRFEFGGRAPGEVDF